MHVTLRTASALTIILFSFSDSTCKIMVWATVRWTKFFALRLFTVSLKLFHERRRHRLLASITMAKKQRSVNSDEDPRPHAMYIEEP